ncbi:MucR family transcriptional regulator [Methylobacterium soli]|uniref:MucR family transcriptional regulator n=1 Tax=Methylobacterium soli TaxID=553447 RepID=A0A6L3SSY9_9HYPH|nr:MucR family transcriptional regulator [Methylobacterium soli]KAB1072553.1 MucR family transcriptional regulator [Methylobacterium soli]GJE43832.1 Transcriptional regulatory protein ros [Methylobacterium soli]
MAEMEEASESNHLELAADIVSAYVSNNPVRVTDLPSLIRDVHAALNNLAVDPSSAAEPEAEKATPSQIRKSITPDALISFLDGKPYKTLKRHLTGHGLDPYSYRERYGLPRDYPMVAANYAAQRSELAKSIGLGRPGAPVAAKAPKGRTRKAG